MSDKWRVAGGPCHRAVTTAKANTEWLEKLGNDSKLVKISVWRDCTLLDHLTTDGVALLEKLAKSYSSNHGRDRNADQKLSTLMTSPGSENRPEVFARPHGRHLI